MNKFGSLVFLVFPLIIKVFKLQGTMFITFLTVASVSESGWNFWNLFAYKNKEDNQKFDIIPNFFQWTPHTVLLISLFHFLLLWNRLFLLLDLIYWFPWNLLLKLWGFNFLLWTLIILTVNLVFIGLVSIIIKTLVSFLF